MTRLSRAELQLRNRAKVLDAARDEFAERGFRDAKIDSIAERAELTRGAVYSNFAGKRALYFAALAELASQPPTAVVAPGRTGPEALGAFAEAWLNRLATWADGLASSDDGLVPLGTQLLPEVLADEDTRWQYAQLMKLSAFLLGLSLEQLGFSDQLGGRRMVGVAELALTTLRGAGELAGAAPGFVQPFNVAKACSQLAELELHDRWDKPPSVPPVRPTDEVWAPPTAVDAVRAGPARLLEDGLVLVLGMNRLAAAEDAVRAAAGAVQAAGPGLPVTVALVSDRPAELAPLGRLAVAEVCSCLRQAFLEPDWPGLQIVHDESGELAAAAGVEELGNGLEFAVRVAGGRIVVRAEGFGAGYAVASTEISTTRNGLLWPSS